MFGPTPFESSQALLNNKSQDLVPAREKPIIIVRFTGYSGIDLRLRNGTEHMFWLLKVNS
jgi:hypothetical protein